MKKKLVVVDSEVSGTDEVKVCKQIDKIEIDLGRGDLNLMRDKINELIEKLNEC